MLTHTFPPSYSASKKKYRNWTRKIYFWNTSTWCEYWKVNLINAFSSCCRHETAHCLWFSEFLDLHWKLLYWKFNKIKYFKLYLWDVNIKFWIKFCELVIKIYTIQNTSLYFSAAKNFIINCNFWFFQEFFTRKKFHHKNNFLAKRKNSFSLFFITRLFTDSLL